MSGSTLCYLLPLSRLKMIEMLFGKALSRATNALEALPEQQDTERKIRMAKQPNYQFEKRRREMDQKKKKEEKKLRKLAENNAQPTPGEPPPPVVG